MKPEYWIRAKRALARRDPVMGGIMRTHPKVFLARRGEPFLTLARAIVGQQISVKAAQSVWDRLVVCVGDITPEGILAKPRPELRACGLSDRKTEYIADLAQHFADLRGHVVRGHHRGHVDLGTFLEKEARNGHEWLACNAGCGGVRSII